MELKNGRVTFAFAVYRFVLRFFSLGIVPFCFSEYLKDHLDHYMANFSKVRVIHLTERQGLIRARMAGAAVATGLSILIYFLVIAKIFIANFSSCTCVLVFVFFVSLFFSKHIFIKCCGHTGKLKMK